MIFKEAIYRERSLNTPRFSGPAHEIALPKRQPLPNYRTSALQPAQPFPVLKQKDTLHVI